MNRPARVVFALAPLLMVVACGGGGADLSRPTAIFGKLDIALLGEGAARDEAPALGSLMMQLPDPETPGKMFALPACTGIQIGPRQVLTAGHCDRAGYVFSKNRIAKDGDTAKIDVSTIGPDLRLEFTGDLIASAAADEAQVPAGVAVFKDTVLDAAVIEFGYDLPPRWIDLSLVSDDLSALAHFGYPNGLPVAVSGGCQGQGDPGDPRFRHDCDSMTGSSGGLLIDQRSGLPVGMQLAAPGYNQSDFYLKTGHFEAPEDFAARRGCTPEAFPAPADYAACVRTRGLNDAVRLAAVAASIAAGNQELWGRLTAGALSSQSAVASAVP